MHKAVIGLFFLFGLLFFVSVQALEGELNPNGISGTVQLEEGWNLATIYAFSDTNLFDVRGNNEVMQEIRDKGVRAIFYYDKYNNKYIQIYPHSDQKEADIFNFFDSIKFNRTDGRDGFSSFANSVMWIYSDKKQTLNYQTSYGPFQYTYLTLTKGYNFVMITPDMVGKTIQEITSNCNMERAYYWNANVRGSSGWSEIGTTNNRFDSENVGYGFVIKVASDCKLGSLEDSVTNPPAIPDENSFVIETTSCVDSDGSNVKTKGKSTYESENQTTEFTDWCDFHYWSNKLGVAERVGVVQEGFCEGKDLFKVLALKCSVGEVCREGKCIQGDSSLSICTDSDGGKVTSQKGKVDGDRGGGEDYCFDKSLNGGQGGFASSCSGVNCFIYEFSCASNEDFDVELVSCSRGCNNGACVQ